MVSGAPWCLLEMFGVFWGLLCFLGLPGVSFGAIWYLYGNIGVFWRFICHSVKKKFLGEQSFLVTSVTTVTTDTTVTTMT